MSEPERYTVGRTEGGAVKVMRCGVTFCYFPTKTKLDQQERRAKQIVAAMKLLDERCHPFTHDEIVDDLERVKNGEVEDAETTA